MRIADRNTLIMLPVMNSIVCKCCYFFSKDQLCVQGQQEQPDVRYRNRNNKLGEKIIEHERVLTAHLKGGSYNVSN